MVKLILKTYQIKHQNKLITMAKLMMFLGLTVLSLTFYSCKSKKVSCDWVDKAEYQQSNNNSSTK
ncbi:MAG: hypothetical protein FJZ67_05060 [Bacteroidetes bacterium]|nr:hypothetical protein [Bacteroidota bacterium]